MDPVPPTTGCSSDVPAAPICPIEPPVRGSACPLPAAVCEYGGADLECRGRWRCSEDQTWQPVIAKCDADRCPAAAPVSGAACDPDVTCAYPAHILCRCARTTGKWVCGSNSADPLCPDRLPLYGATCDHNGLVCFYGGCFAYASRCCGGSWILAPYTCADVP